MELDTLLSKLRNLLTAELRAQRVLKEVKQEKEAVLDKLNELIKADNFANDFVTLRKKPQIKLQDEQIAAPFMKDIKQLDKKLVEDYFYSGQETPGVKVELKLIAYKKRGALE